MSNGQKHPNTYCENSFCFDIACSFHRLYIARSSMQEPPKCLRCGLPNCAHTPPDLPDLVNLTPAPPRLYPQLPSAPPAELSDDSSIESIDESLKTTDAEQRGTIPASPQATAMAMAGARAQANPTVERGPHRRRHKRPIPLPLPVATVAPNVTSTTASTSTGPTLGPGETIWNSVPGERRRRRASFTRPRNSQSKQSGKTDLFIVRKR